jgi:hypothetical protein
VSGDGGINDCATPPASRWRPVGLEKKANQIKYSAAAFTISMMVISLAKDDHRGLERVPKEDMSWVYWRSRGTAASAGRDRAFAGALESGRFNPM